jgi:hypothetical protein
MSEVFGGNMAFPIHNTGHGAPFDEGMSLRDYIAIHAMQSILQNYDPVTSFEEDGIQDADSMPKLIAKDAYIMADAMLKARVEGEQ